MYTTYWASCVLLGYYRTDFIKYLINNKSGVLFRLQSFWVGIHHSKYTKRTCINLLPCITIWIGTKPTNI